MIKVKHGHVMYEGARAELMAELATIIHSFCTDDICSEEDVQRLVKHAFHPETLEEEIEDNLNNIKEMDDKLGELLTALFELI